MSIANRGLDVPREEPIKNLLPRLNTRREYFDYLDRWTVGTVDDLRAHMTTRALTKGFLLETSRSNGARDALGALGSLNQEITPIDNTLYRLHRRGEEGDWALIEVEDQRYPVLYTALESTFANSRVDRLIQNSPLLDRAWFAAPMFQNLWQLIIGAFPPNRFSQIVFEHECLYEAFADEPLESPDDAATDDMGLTKDEEEVLGVERRRARMQITERIGKLAEALPKMRPNYEPLESIVRLRMPAPRRGGHDVYFDGRFTNRSDSIVSLRQTIQTVTDIYRRATERAEESSWPSPIDAIPQGRPISLGSPLLVKFGEQLDIDTFDRWIAALRRKNNRFRLWGTPISLGEGKVHLYATDNHLWQPIDLEITRDHLYAILPLGTCGNTIHRLVTNLQRFIAPKLETYIGNQKYEDFISGESTSRLGGGIPSA